MRDKFPDPKDIPVSGRLKTCLSLVKKQGLEKKILVDVGSSVGWLEVKLKREPLKEIIGIEPNKKAVELARKHAKKAKFFISTASKLPVKDNYADLVMMFDVIEHVPSGTESIALSEIWRILKRGGKLLLSTPNSHPILNLTDPAWYLGHRHYRTEEIHRLLERAGFNVLFLEKRGYWWSLIYMLWFYFMKWVFRQPLPRNRWLEKRDDVEYSREGIFTIFALAEKK